MRNPNRINVLSDIYQRVSVKKAYLKNIVGIHKPIDIDRFVSKWEQKEDEIKNIWHENPNLRVGEVLMMSKVLPHFSGGWMHTEDEEFMEKFRIADKRSTLVFNKIDGNLPDRGIPLKNTSDKDLYKFQSELGDETPNYILKEIQYRKDNGINVTENGNPYYSLDID